MNETSTARADLHCHSRFSDGSLTVEQLFSRARELGLSHLGITDHDGCEGFAEGRRCENLYGIKYIPGMEISAWDPPTGRRIHLLGYGLPEKPGQAVALGQRILRDRDANTRRQIRILAREGYPLDEAAVEAEAAPARWLYKQHIMGVLVARGQSPGIYGPLYKSLFKGDGPAAGDIDYVDVREALAALKADGALAVLAHPGQQDSLDLVPELAAAGLDGLEWNHFDNSPQVQDHIRDLARKYNLFLTGGSDFHGDYGRETDPDLGALLSPPNVLLT